MHNMLLLPMPTAMAMQMLWHDAQCQIAMAMVTALATAAPNHCHAD